MTSSFDLIAGPVTASLVVSSAGIATSDEGSSKGLGNQTDLALLKWFRSRSEVVLTSGKTAEIENYKLPSSAELAILSKAERKYESLGAQKSKVIFLKNLDSYAQSIDALLSLGYSRIHCEFGPSGFVDLLHSGLVEGFVSSKEVSGIELFANSHDLVQGNVQLLGGDLFVAQLFGRG